MQVDKAKLKVAIIGAGGKMGCRTTDNLSKHPYVLLLCDKSSVGLARICDKGLTPIDAVEAVPQADVVILAVPDRMIGAVSAELVPQMKNHATMVLLDPAAAYIGELCLRHDCTFVVCHPCHPALFSRQDSLEAMFDHFGGTLAKQDIVIALLQGTESDFARGRAVCIDMFAPVDQCHEITVEQMAILEPATAEVAAGSAISIMKEAMDEAIRRGVPGPAARSFVLGHIKVISAVMFGETDFPISDAAQAAVKIGYKHLVKKDWKRIFEPEVVRQTIKKMVHGE
jgi:hypothetical protein